MIDSVKPEFHIITCGISILTNYNSMRQKNEKETLDFKKINKLGQEEHKWIEIHKNLYNFLKKNPTKNSAEVNSLNHYFKNSEVKRIYLMCTDTNIGLMCAKVLKSFIVDDLKISNVDFKRIEGFGTEDFEKGLLEIRNTLINLITSHNKEYKIRLNATGGFKPESAMLILIGSLYQIPVYYIHESKRDLVNIPPFPVLYLEKDYMEILNKLITNPSGLRIKSEVKRFENKYGDRLDYLLSIGAIERKVREDGTREYKINQTGKQLYKLGPREDFPINN